jgi:hypothetical protein
MSEPVARLADRAAADPHFLAFALAEYATAQNIDRAGLLAALGAAEERFPHVQLCRAPRADPDGFREDVDRIAAKFGLNRDVLAAAVRHRVGAEGGDHLPLPDPDKPGVVIAARDRPKS